MKWPWGSFSRRSVGVGALAAIAAAAAIAITLWYRGGRGVADAGPGQGPPRAGEAPRAEARPPDVPPNTVKLGAEQQRAVGLRTARVTAGASHGSVTVPGRIAPNESQYAYITPRAAGVVRSVSAHLGQDVKAGDLLATIDSPEVGDARLELYTRLQTLDVARDQATWQGTIYRNTLDLLDSLRKGESPERIHAKFADKAVGANREKLMTAYAQYRLGVATIERNRDLFQQKLITPKQFEKVNADYEVAQATYQSLMDEMGYEARLANTRAQQAKRQAETAVRAAKERLRILGVKPDGTEPEVEGGKVVGVKPDGTLPATDKPETGPEARPETILTPSKEKERVAVEPVGSPPGDGHQKKPKVAPVSSYSIWAPFDGTILDREMIVPGVAVDTTHRIFTMANLATVYVEANVQEGDFDALARSRGGKVRFRSPAYPGRVFEGEVIYAGDLVEETSRSVKLLARAPNPERMLKPGMFVEVEILAYKATTVAQVPASAILTEGDRSYVYVRTGPESFARREVEVESTAADRSLVRGGLEIGEEVVVEGAFKLKAVAVQLASAER